MNLTQGETILLAIVIYIWLLAALGVKDSIVRWNSRVKPAGKTIIFISCLFLWPWIICTNIMDMTNQMRKNSKSSKH